MRRTVPLVAALLIAVFTGVLVSSPAEARGGYRSHAHFSFAFGFPAPFYYPAPLYYPYPSYYYPQPVYVPPPQYIEQNPATQPPPPPPASTAPSQGASGHYWYYCADSQTYYPYVQTCASQWQQVVPNAGPPS